MKIKIILNIQKMRRNKIKMSKNPQECVFTCSCYDKAARTVEGGTMPSRALGGPAWGLG